ncbi:uncharacterized protein LOC106398828 [Brassica napus]|uniref:uncharacterized protein LOC106337999 n=1 Tax=Brassica oleracea var. oleracea TaxID=109376 RepID=UPI0006A6B742|nr:PREDICTED: uncharacterized protein LOC106337999 [Brassica oleracea var. oleracea]XP_013694785.2 uncharacterized protein LOC106398828 [Brassica napus]
MEDYYEWEVDERLRQKYNTGEIYTYLKGHHPQVPWAKIIWFSYGIPRHSFLMWLVLLDRLLPYGDRLLLDVSSNLSSIGRTLFFQLQMLPSNRDSLRLTLLAIQDTIYWIRTERNNRLNQQAFKPLETIISTIDKQIRNLYKASSKPIPELLQRWHNSGFSDHDFKRRKQCFR